MKLLLLNFGFLYPHVRSKHEPKNHPKYKEEINDPPTWETKAPHEKCSEPIRVPTFSYGKNEIIGYIIGYELESEYLIDLIKEYDVMSFENDNEIIVYLDVKGKRCRQR